MKLLQATGGLRSQFSRIRRFFITRQSQKAVNTWSPLATAFNYPQARQDSPHEATGLFGLLELSSSSGFDQMKRQALLEGEKLVENALKLVSNPKLVDVFDELSDVLCRAADLAEFVRMSHPDKKFRKAAENTSLGISAFVEMLNTNRELYDAMKSVFTNQGITLDEETRQVAELFLFDFELSGIHLDEEKRKKFVELQEKVLILGAHFSNGASMAVLVPRKECPDRISSSFPTSGNNVAIDTMYLESSNEELRALAFRAHLQPIESQIQYLDLLLSARNELANLVDFQTYASRALEGTMARTPKNVMDFLKLTANMLEKPAKNELEILANMKRIDSGNKESRIMPWDLQYYIGMAKSRSLSFNSSSLSAYFPLGSCMEGLNVLFQSLYGISLVPEDAQPGELWCPEVQKIGVVHETEGMLGYIYCDFLVRPEKIQQDSHFTIRGGRTLSDGSYQLPIVAVICNFPPPSPSAPSLLTHGMVENLFHEMGHAMHSMLARTRYQHVTGTRCATDFAEVPSVLMENFVWDPRVLSKFAKHYRTGHSLPEETITKLSRSRNMFGALEMQRQVLYSMVDQVYHGKHPLAQSTTDTMTDLQKKYTAIPHVEGTAWQQRFSHLNGYGARYYSYLWSRAVASKVWHQCFAADPFNREMGERYRNTMLAHGGSKDPNSLVANMLGHEITIHEMVQSLQDDLGACNHFH